LFIASSIAIPMWPAPIAPILNIFGKYPLSMEKGRQFCHPFQWYVPYYVLWHE